MLRTAILSPSPLYLFLYGEGEKERVSQQCDWLGQDFLPSSCKEPTFTFPQTQTRGPPPTTPASTLLLALLPAPPLCILSTWTLCNDNQRPWRSEPCAGHPPHLLLLPTFLIFPHFFFYLHETEHHGGRPNIAKGEC